jgi:DMSO/TMAO reductase YedYZ molybdopterin-dependent catalytic subunit
MKNQLELDDLPVFPHSKEISRPLRLQLENDPHNSITVSMNKIEKLPKVKLTEDFKCLEGWVVKGVVWEGVPVSGLLRSCEHRLGYQGAFFLFGSKDFTCQLSRRIAFRKTTILATKMYGKKLTRIQGGPLRLVFQGHKCYESIKSVDRMVLLRARTKTTAHSIATARIRNN